jgi:predicted nucleic acid-binding protein
MSRVLVDTSVWIDHFRKNNNLLVTLLNNHRVLMHSMIRGELACGHLRHRLQILALLKHLPHVSEATHDEALTFMDNKQLMGRGIGFVDVHLLAATVLTPGARIWTRDSRLSVVAQSLEIAWQSD